MEYSCVNIQYSCTSVWNIALGKIICIRKLKQAHFKWKIKTSSCSKLQVFTNSEEGGKLPILGATQRKGIENWRLHLEVYQKTESWLKSCLRRVHVRPQLHTHTRTCQVPSAGATLKMSRYRLRTKRIAFFIFLNAIFLMKCLRTT